MVQRPSPLFNRPPREFGVTTTARGFTLVELLVTIGIIAILASLVTAVAGGILSRSERGQVESSFQMLEQAIVAFEETRGQPLVFNRRTAMDSDDDATKNDRMKFSDIDELPPDVMKGAYIMPRLVGLLAANPGAWEVMQGISPDLLLQETPPPWPDGVKTVWNLRDPWGEQIAVVPSGRPATRGEIKSARALLKLKQPTKDADPLKIGIDLDDATVRTPDEKSLSTLCKGRKWLFISRGSDRQLGSPQWSDQTGPNSDASGDGIPDWGDNVFNYDPGRPGL